MKKFIIALIYLIKRLIFMLDNNKKIVYKELSKDSNIYFNEKTIKDIFIHLRNSWI